MTLQMIHILNSDPIRIRPFRQIINLNETRTITCTSRTIPTWTLNNAPIPKNTKDKGYMLILDKITLENRGIYTCQGTIDLERNITFYAESTVFVKGVYSYFRTT